MTPRRAFVVEADGGSRGNPGPAGYGAVVLDAATGELLSEVAESIGRATNNVAEYRGLLAGLRAAIAIDPACTVEVRMDSKLVVEQMSGRWQIKHADMRALADEARGVLPPERVRYTWIPRGQNARADRLANEAMDAAAAGRAWSRSASSSSSTATSSVTMSTAGGTSVGGASVGGASSASDFSGPVPPASPVRSGPGTSASSEPDSARAPRRADLGDPTVVVLIRHGRTAYTEERRMSGIGGADPALSEAGRADAAAAADLLDRLGGPDSPVPDVGRVRAVVCSPLLRTRQTAQAVADRLRLPVVPDDGWAEIAFGEWDGLTYAEIAERWPAEMAAWQGSTTVAPPGGESLADHAARIEKARHRLVTEHPGGVVAVVAHVTPIRCVVAEALDAGPAALWRMRISPASVTAVRYWSDGGAEVLTVNHVP